MAKYRQVYGACDARQQTTQRMIAYRDEPGQIARINVIAKRRNITVGEAMRVIMHEGLSALERIDRALGAGQDG